MIGSAPPAKKHGDLARRILTTCRVGDSDEFRVRLHRVAHTRPDWALPGSCRITVAGGGDVAVCRLRDRDLHQFSLSLAEVLHGGDWVLEGHHE